ncbi:MAG: hypothetical protein JWP87_2110 [Labilithrix sp.]|jgi:hypothetical protein|nr:hypothetical protein [Labilithrix sp.]
MREREPDVEALRTRLARKFTTLADEVTECFNEFHIGGGDYVVELLAPEGQTTGGGKQALQHLRLRPRRDGYAAIVAGSVNPIEKHAELRSYEHAALVHEIRFGKGLEITPAEWEQLLRKSEVVLHLANIETARVGPSPDLLRESRRKKLDRRVSSGAIALFVVVLLLAAGVAVLVFRKITGNP